MSMPVKQQESIGGGNAAVALENGGDASAASTSASSSVGASRAFNEPAAFSPAAMSTLQATLVNSSDHIPAQAVLPPVIVPRKLSAMHLAPNADSAGVPQQLSAQLTAPTTPEQGSPKPPPCRRVASELTNGSPQMTGMKPRVMMRKRGKSFKETKKMDVKVDEQGRRHLNEYTFLEELGHGAYGVVLKVLSNETKELLAAKAVDKRALKKVRVGRFGNALQSVKKELAIWKRFKHRHIVVLHEIIDSDDSDELFMISELMTGGTVLDDDVNCTPLDNERTKLYFCQLIEGIDFLHENKIIHRDIKPGNLLLKIGEEGERILKISDFGVSHEMETDDDSLRQTAGTAIFNAPEMLTGDKFHGKPIDIWACGITLYMFVYGHPPFVAKTMTELYDKIQNAPIEYPPVVGDKVVDAQLIDLMKNILEKNPDTRYTTKQIRAHPWAWRDFQVTAVKCVTQPDGRRGSSSLPKTLAGVAAVGKSLRHLLGRKSVLPAMGSSSKLLPVTGEVKPKAAAPPQ